jgi:hypothetical protein
MAGAKRTHRDLVRAMRSVVDSGTLAAPAGTYDPVMEGGAELGAGRARAAVEAGRPLRPSESRAVRHETLGAQAGRQPAGQPATKKPTLRDRLEAMSDNDREAAIASVTPGTRARAYIERLVASIRGVEEEADLLVAQEDEERLLAEGEDDYTLEEEAQALANIDPAGEWQLVEDDDEPGWSDDVEDGYDFDEEAE